MPVVLAAAIAVTGLSGRFEAISEVVDPYEAQDPSIRGRSSEALVALLMTREHPVIGIGAGRYTGEYIAYAPRVGLDERQVREPHNSYLEMASESGVLGLAAFIGLLVTGIVGALRAVGAFARQGRRLEAGLAQSVASGLLGYSVAAIFLHQAYPQMLWLGLGLAAALMIRVQRMPAAPTGER
jgi:O-antigen ligase